VRPCAAEESESRRLARRIETGCIREITRTKQVPVTVAEVVMAFRTKVYFVIIGLVVQLVLFGLVEARPVEVSDSASGWKIPDTESEDGRLTLISMLPCIVEGEIVGVFAVYDDPTTDRLADYWELYGSEGDLIAISWFDRFGIQRLAVDRGLIEESDKLEGTFVVFLDGNSV
jgi:hypothetical protein